MKSQSELQNWANKIGAKYQELTRLYQQSNQIMKTISKHLKNKYALPNEWHVYSIQILKGEGEKIIEIKGRNARTLKRGKNIGKLKYDGGCQKTYLMQLSEYHQIVD